jgi:hypothetical protein
VLLIHVVPGLAPGFGYICRKRGGDSVYHRMLPENGIYARMGYPTVFRNPAFCFHNSTAHRHRHIVWRSRARGCAAGTVDAHVLPRWFSHCFALQRGQNIPFMQNGQFSPNLAALDERLPKSPLVVRGRPFACRQQPDVCLYRMNERVNEGCSFTKARWNVETRRPSAFDESIRDSGHSKDVSEL